MNGPVSERNGTSVGVNSRTIPSVAPLSVVGDQCSAGMAVAAALAEDVAGAATVGVTSADSYCSCPPLLRTGGPGGGGGGTDSIPADLRRLAPPFIGNPCGGGGGRLTPLHLSRECLPFGEIK